MIRIHYGVLLRLVLVNESNRKTFFSKYISKKTFFLVSKYKVRILKTSYCIGILIPGFKGLIRFNKVKGAYFCCYILIIF